MLAFENATSQGKLTKLCRTHEKIKLVEKLVKENVVVFAGLYLFIKPLSGFTEIIWSRSHITGEHSIEQFLILPDWDKKWDHNFT